MLITSIPTALIPDWRQARRSRKGGGSVACAEQGDGSGAIRSKPAVRVSHAWLRVSFLEGETQRGVCIPRWHTMANVASRSLGRILFVSATSQQDRRTPNEGADGVESRPNHDGASMQVNTRSPTSVGAGGGNRHGDGGPIVPNRLPVMGLAAGSQPGSPHRYQGPAMASKPDDGGGKWDSLCIRSSARTEDC